MCFRYYFHFCRGDNSLKDPASKSYDQVFRPHHGWVIQKAVALGMCALPTRSQLLTMLNEEGECILTLYQIRFSRSSTLEIVIEISFEIDVGFMQ